ncbi:MAG: GNAT family N-acetyltransferase [Sedimenticola sp.]|nr:GNAT family N-acetyltransferase [Sedimenticola sp.]
MNRRKKRVANKEEGMMTKLRDAAEADFPAILNLNALEVRQTSPLDAGQLADLHTLSCFHQVATVHGQVAGFLLALPQGTPYQSDNYTWFDSRYPSFIYVDRIVIGADYSGQGIGGQLYRALFRFARDNAVPLITCEYNIEPPNPGSRAFHARFGFLEVGQQSLPGGKRVSLQMVDPDIGLVGR